MWPESVSRQNYILANLYYLYWKMIDRRHCKNITSKNMNPYALSFHFFNILVQNHEIFFFKFLTFTIDVLFSYQILCHIVLFAV